MTPAATIAMLLAFLGMGSVQVSIWIDEVVVAELDAAAVDGRTGPR